MRNDSITADEVKKYAVGAIFAASLCHFLLLLFGIILQSLQLDFSSLYATGRSLNQGADPYVNQLGQNPDLWDGFSPYQASKFLYPPLAALIFQGLALFPYSTAKELWSMSIILCLIFSVALQCETLGFKFSRQVWLLIASVILFFFPLTAEIECGQIDALCLLFLSLAIYCQLRPLPRQILAGAFVALASLFKLHCGLIVFYLLLKRQYKTALGFFGGWVLLGICSVAVYGWQMQMQYVFVDMPRIAKYACYGNEDMRVDPLILGMADHDTKVLSSNIQGAEYVITGLNFSPYSGIPYYVKLLLQSDFTYGTWALITAFFIYCLVLFHEIKIKRATKNPGTLLSDYLFWQIVFTAVLLSGPITWIMNSVWLIPLIPFCFYYFSHIKTRNDAIGWILLVLGLFIIGFPDETSGVHAIDMTYLFLIFKPILGELLCFTGLLRIYYTVRTREPEPQEAPART